MSATEAPIAGRWTREAVERQFQSLKAQWREGTRFISNATKKETHPAYQRIIGLGPAVVPALLDELRREPSWWFWALECITGEDPTPPEAAGNLDEMTAAWLDWARRHPEWAGAGAAEPAAH